MATPPPREGQFLLYRTDEGRTRVECRFEQDSLWLSQASMAALFDTSKQNIAKHLKAIFTEGELQADAVVNSWLTTAADGKRYRVLHYHLEAVLAVGYRVRSSRGTQFRQWATEQLREYLTKGFAMDDERLKNPDASVYFEQLLERIRDIRSSEKVFWKKVLEIYATSEDYDPRAEVSQQFFATLQNKMHWAAHGHTAAEMIMARADASKTNLGMTHHAGALPRRSEAGVAKNYLSAEELDTLNRIVTAYLEFAELQARRHRPMTMRAWISKLDDFLRMSDHDVLTHAGRVTAEAAKAKAQAEYDAWLRQQHALPSPAEQDMTRILEQAARALPNPKDKKTS